MILLELLYHGFPSLSDWLWMLFDLLFYSLVVLTPFILGGLAIYVLRKKKNAEDV